MLKLYNTLSKQVEEVPKKGHLNLYSCGPTVYNYAHIGNLRSYILADLLYRTLKYEGYNPKWVMNITDIDDKTIKGTIGKYGKDATVDQLREFTTFYLDEFLKDLAEVNILKDEITFIRVTDVIPQIQEFIVGLINKGYAYKADDGSTYFSIEKYQKDFGDYGELVGKKFLEGKKVGARVKMDEYDKENLSDFALWKAHDAADANIFWDHPTLGKGRPGWHIECSVINQIGFNGEPTDIHTGGVDLVFPHHTNEIAQSQALVAKGNFVHQWFHSEHLLVDGKKMAKSAKNFYTLKDINAKGTSGLDFRYSMLSSGFRGQQNFTWESLGSAHNTLERLCNFASSAKPHQVGCAQYEQDFSRAVDEDLNIPQALAVVWKLIDDEEMPKEARINSLLKFDKIFGLNLANPPQEISVPAEIQNLLEQRKKAKDGKDFKKSDEFRDQIDKLGYEVMDMPEGQKVKKKLSI